MRINILHNNVYDYLLKNNIKCEYDDEDKQIKIYVQIEEIQVELYMRFPQYYPYEFPKIYIEDTKGIHIPNIYINNQLCLYDLNETLPNPERFLEEALETVERAKKLLIDSKKQKNITNYQFEIISFWKSEAIGFIDYLGNENYESRTLWSYEIYKNNFVVSEEKNKINDFLENTYRIKRKNISFKKALFINIGIKKQNLIQLNKIKDILEIIPETDIPRFHSFLIDNSCEGIVILYVDNGVGTCFLALKISLMLFRIEPSKKNISSIIMINKDRKFERLYVKNFEMARLFLRGGDGTANFDKKCLMIGCGSIGSYLSKGIVDIGISKNITLIDNDILNVENLARHLCGSHYLCFPGKKSEALKMELLNHYPTMNCIAIDENAWEFILNKHSVINGYDLVLICVGNTVIEKKVIQLIKEKIINTECIIMWTEPYMIAGHALILQNNIDEKTENSIFYANGSFNNNIIIDSRKYMKNEAGCQSVYAPYGGFEVQKFVLDFLDIYYRKIYSKKEKCNYEFTWIGKIKWARQQNINIKPKWRAKDERYIEIKRIDDE